LARKILLADDSVTAQNMGRKILADAGYEVITVNNGSAALKRVSETKPDLIILDVYMPGYSGLEVCQRLKDAHDTSFIPVLLSVGKLEPFKPQEARRVRADGHIVKPFEASELLSAVAKLEDCIVPQANRSQFCSPVATEISEEYARRELNDSFSGRKSGSRAGSKKKKDESGSGEDWVANFRDFRKGKGRPTGAAAENEAETGATAADEAKPSATQAAAHEPTPVPDVPRDITPEELDALSAVALRLDQPAAAGRVPAAEEQAAPAAMVGAQNLPEEQEQMPVVAPAAETAELVAAAAEAQTASLAKEIEAAAAVEAMASAPSVMDVPTAAVEPVGAIAIPKPAVAGESSTDKASQSESPQAESSAVETPGVESATIQSPTTQSPTTQFPTTQSAQIESSQAESSENDEVPATVAFSGAAVEAEPAPVDRQDEPMFASAVEEKVEAKAAEVVEASIGGVEKVEIKQAETGTEAQAAKMEEAGSFAAASAATMSRVEEAAEEAPAPSEDELAEALRLLTPATGNTETAASGASAQSAEAHGKSGSQAGMVGSESSEGVIADSTGAKPAGAHWTAEAVGLTAEEAAMSLEAEMFRTFATAAAGESADAPAADRVSMITAAVENRLAEADLPTADVTTAEAAMEAVPDEAPKAMAAAAAAETPAAQQEQPQEETAIAHIVDKVLADLRPKIVEEITKSLGKK